MSAVWDLEQRCSPCRHPLREHVRGKGWIGRCSRSGCRCRLFAVQLPLLEAQDARATGSHSQFESNVDSGTARK